jgi:hypothetical protein
MPEGMMKRSVFAGWLVLALTSPPALAAESISGADAAYLDWAVVNCELKTTDKEHGLAEAANATGGAAFQKGLVEQRRRLAAVTTPTAKASLCGDLKDWYGPSGSRTEGLLTWPQAPAPGVSVGKKTGSEGGGKGGGHRRGGGGG